MTILTVAGSKGGPGKTTVAALIAYSAARDGARVTVVDADPTGNLHRWITRVYGGPPIECLAEPNEARLGHLIADRMDSADLVLVDTAGFGNLAANVAMGAADGVLVPMVPGEGDLTEAERTVQMVAALSRTTRRDIPVRVVLNRAQANTALTRHVVAEAATARLPVLEARLGHRVASYGELGFTGKLPAARDPASAEVAALLRELRALGWVPEARSALVKQDA